MKTKTRYYIRYNAKPIGFNFEDYKTLKDLETGIKKFMDNKITFEVWVKFEFGKNPDIPYGFDNYTSFEIWYYDSETDGVSNFNHKEFMRIPEDVRNQVKPMKLVLSEVEVFINGDYH